MPLIAFKARLGQDLRRFSLADAEVTTQGLTFAVRKAYNLTNENEQLTIKYVDEEQDLITLSSESDVEEMVRLYLEGSLRVQTLVVSTSVANIDVEEERKPRHFGVTCDGCQTHPICGIRYKSLTREDFDLCEACHAKDTSGDQWKAFENPKWRHHHHGHHHGRRGWEARGENQEQEQEGPFCKKGWRRHHGRRHFEAAIADLAAAVFAAPSGSPASNAADFTAALFAIPTATKPEASNTAAPSSTAETNPAAAPSSTESAPAVSSSPEGLLADLSPEASSVVSDLVGMGFTDIASVVNAVRTSNGNIHDAVAILLA